MWLKQSPVNSSARAVRTSAMAWLRVWSQADAGWIFYLFRRAHSQTDLQIGVPGTCARAEFRTSQAPGDAYGDPISFPSLKLRHKSTGRACLRACVGVFLRTLPACLIVNSRSLTGS